MSDVQKGAQRVRRVEKTLHTYGYRTMLASRSGQRRGERGASLALDGDLIAIAPTGGRWPHLIIEVGGKSKSVLGTIREMMAQGPLPGGFVPVVVRLVDAKTRKPGAGWRWHLSSDEGHDTLAELLDAVAS